MPTLTLKTKMTLATSLLVAGIALFVGFVNLFEFERHYKKIIADQQFLLISALADEIDDKLETAQKSLIEVAKLITPGMIADKQQAGHFINDRVGIASIFKGGLGLFNSEGYIVATNTNHNELFNKNFSYRDYFKQTVATAKPVISEPFKLSFAPYNPAVMFTAPILDHSGAVLALFTGALNLTQDNFISKLAHIKIGESGYLYLFNRNRLMIMHPERERVFQTDVPLGVNVLFDAAINGFEGSGETVNSHGVPMLASFKTLKKNGWILAATNPLDQAYAPLVTARHQFYLMLGFAILVAMTLTWLLMQYLTAPLLTVIQHIAAMSSKQGNNRFLRIETHDEIATLAERFNQMVAELDGQMESIQRLAAFKKVIEEDDCLDDVYFRLGTVFRQMGLDQTLIYEVSDDQHKMRLVYPAVCDDETIICNDKILDQSRLCEAKRTSHPICSLTFAQICRQFFSPCGHQHHCIPISVSGSIVGVVRLIFTSAVANNSEEIAQKVNEVEQYIKESLSVIEAKRLLHKLRESVLVDPLTGLRNRRFLQEYTENLVSITQRHEKNIGLIMCDLDYFKQVNDRFGHAAGDRVLQETAQLVKNSIRDSDLVIRFGGEEFLVVLLDIDPGSAITVAEKIREAVQSAAFHLSEGVIKQTISLGISELPQDTDQFWQSIKFADMALYRAKAAGRNCAIRFTEEIWQEVQH